MLNFGIRILSQFQRSLFFIQVKTNQSLPATALMCRPFHRQADTGNAGRQRIVASMYHPVLLSAFRKGNGIRGVPRMVLQIHISTCPVILKLFLFIEIHVCGYGFHYSCRQATGMTGRKFFRQVSLYRRTDEITYCTFGGILCSHQRNW